MEIDPIELARLPTDEIPPLPAYQAGIQTDEPVFSASSKVSLMRSSISSLSPKATAQTVNRSGVDPGELRLGLLDRLADGMRALQLPAERVAVGEGHPQRLGASRVRATSLPLKRITKTPSRIDASIGAPRMLFPGRNRLLLSSLRSKTKRNPNPTTATIRPIPIPTHRAGSLSGRP